MGEFNSLELGSAVYPLPMNPMHVVWGIVNSMHDNYLTASRVSMISLNGTL